MAMNLKLQEFTLHEVGDTMSSFSQGGNALRILSNIQPLPNGKGHFLLDMYLLSNMVEGH